MYLISVEGGDGSGKGLATQMIAEILEDEFTFTGVDTTAEPRRDAALGQMAVEAVRTGEAGPVREAVYFAADRLEHSHTWIRPRLAAGRVVVSERNIHSSLVYQGIVGELGIEEVARMNAAALVPDLCVWVDCDPEEALRRISAGAMQRTITTRNPDDQEYFETDEFAPRIRQGYWTLLGGEVPMPTPFDTGQVVGPIMNTGSKGELRTALLEHLRRFLHSRPKPLNIETSEVEHPLIAQALVGQRGQTTLDVLPEPLTRSNDDWLNESNPWEVMRDGCKLYTDAVTKVDATNKMQIPGEPLSHTVLSIVGTLSLLPSAEVSELRRWLGPVRMVTERHTQRMVKFLHEQSGWIRVHRPLIGTDAPRSELRPDWQSFGRVGMCIWPLKEAIEDWRKSNPRSSWKYALSGVCGRNPGTDIRAALDDCVARITILGSGKEGVDAPSSHAELLTWWTEGPA